MRILCVLLSHFPWRCEIQRHLDIEERPIMVVQSREANSSRKVVIDYSPGLENLPYGLSVQQALARHENAEIIQADLPHYRSIFSQILYALEQVSPLVEGAELGLIYVGVDGLQLIYRNDNSLVNAVREVVADFSPQIGIAENKFLASLAVRHSPQNSYKVLNGNTDSFLKGLPCDVLPVSLKSKSKLREFGIYTLGQVATMLPGPLLSQFGPEGKRIWELSRGIDDTPLHPRFMEEVIEESVTLPSVTVSMDAILTSTESLLLQVFPDIIRKGLGIRNLTLWTRTWNAEHWERTINFKEPAIDVRGIASRLKRVLENYPQPGPVEQVGIRVNRLGYPLGRQKNLFSDIRAKEHLADNIKQLELKLGSPQIYKVKEVEPWSRIPERRRVLTPISQ